MCSSCGFNMAPFREYLSAVVSSFMDRNWLSFCLLHKKELCRFPGPSKLCCSLQPVCPPLLSPVHLPAYPSTGWELGIFFSSVKLLVICKKEARFFVSCETLDTGKWASPSSHLWCRGGGETERFAAARQLSSPQTGEKYEA